MSSRLHICQFKSFIDQTLEIAPLTVLSGLNSSGKSSVLQAIQMCHGGRLLDKYGDITELLSSGANSHEFSIRLEIGDAENSVRESSFEIIGSSEGLRRVILPDDAENTGFECEYIGADRMGPQGTLPVRARELRDGVVGGDGRYIVEVLERFSRMGAGGVPPELRADGLGEISALMPNLNAWMHMISPGFDVDYEILERGNIGLLIFTKDRRRATNVGFGLSYTLPIIAAVLLQGTKQTASKGRYPRFLLIENPEAHLHPRGQTFMGRLLARAASCGVHCVVETHSEHLLNGIRLSVKENILDSRNAVCYFFSYDIEDEFTKVAPIFIDSNGMCDHWPVGFFDESEISLMALV